MQLILITIRLSTIILITIRLNIIIQVECKWKNAAKLTSEMLTTLEQRAVLLSQAINVKVVALYFFVKKADSSFVAEAKKRGIKVIEFDNFFM